MWMTYKTQVLLHSHILQLARKLWQNAKLPPKVILTLKKAAILDFRSSKKNISHSQKLYDLSPSKIIQLGQLSGVLFKNVYF